jgi:hypothetical protein
MLLPVPPDLAYKAHVTRILIVLLGNCSLHEYMRIGCDYILSVPYYCFIVSSRDRMWTIHSYGKFLSLESPCSGLSGTDYRLMRAPAYVFEELSLISYLLFRGHFLLFIFFVSLSSQWWVRHIVCAVAILCLVIHSHSNVWYPRVFTGCTAIIVFVFIN